MANRILILGLFLLGIGAVQSFSFIANDDGSRQTNRRYLTEAVQHLFNSDDPESLLVTFIDPDMFVWHIMTSGDDSTTFAKCTVGMLDSIRRALQHHRPENPLWVFTDAPSVHSKQTYDEVMELSQKMGYQIFFVIAGPCYGNNTEAYYRVYQDLAKDTNGQVFFLEKSEIGKMVEYVQNYRDYSKDIIMSTIVQPGSPDIMFEVTLDVKMEELTISATGDEPVVTVTDLYLGRLVDTTEVIKLSKVTIVKFASLAGVYKVTVSSKSETHVLVSAATSLTFQVGFSAQPPADFNDTTRLPKPSTSHISIMLHNGEKDMELRSVQILDMENAVLGEERLKVVDTATNHFYTTEIVAPLAPDDLYAVPAWMFQIVVNIYDKSSGTHLWRHGLTPITMETAKCRLPMAAGPLLELNSYAYLKWYYNSFLDECRPFSYGGSFGNDNRFDSAAECRSECGGTPPPDAPTIEKCQLPTDVGPCGDRPPLQWYYDDVLRECRMLHGGCVRVGGGSWYDTEEQCLRECAPVTETPALGKCEESVQQGPCEGDYRRWYYDQSIGECRLFTYGGCLGNANNFPTLEMCSAACAPPAPPTPEKPALGGGSWYDTKEQCLRECAPVTETPALGKCEESVQQGPCEGDYRRWYYDQSIGECRLFTYGGCLGNANNFPTLEMCSAACAPPAPPTPEKPALVCLWGATECICS